LETSPSKGDVGAFLGTPCKVGTGSGGTASSTISTNWAIQGRARLGEKKPDLPHDAKREVIEPAHPQISIARQCDLVGLPRSTYYYHAQGESAENLTLMRLLDEQYTDTPYYGVRRLTAWLRSQGYAVNHKRVAQLLRTMGLETIYPKPRRSEPHPAHRIYPYLLRGVPITRGNQVWSTDITYIWLHGGFIYLVAVMDWFRRYVLSWVLSITMDVGFCLDALEQALEVARAEIFNSDQGAQFTSLEFSGWLAAAGIQISVDGRSTMSLLNSCGGPSNMRRFI